MRGPFLYVCRCQDRIFSYKKERENCLTGRKIERFERTSKVTTCTRDVRRKEDPSVMGILVSVPSLTISVTTDNEGSPSFLTRL